MRTFLSHDLPSRFVHIMKNQDHHCSSLSSTKQHSLCAESPKLKQVNWFCSGHTSPGSSLPQLSSSQHRGLVARVTSMRLAHREPEHLFSEHPPGASVGANHSSERFCLVQLLPPAAERRWEAPVSREPYQQVVPTGRQAPCRGGKASCVCDFCLGS